MAKNDFGDNSKVKNLDFKESGTHGSPISESKELGRPLVYFILTVLGFSFWFFLVVPFASHRETYWWLAMVHSQPFDYSFGIISSTYRPLAQATTWAAFKLLDPDIFPTSVIRQGLLQGFIYGMFLIAWWLIYHRAAQRRLFSILAFIVGGVFISGYVHLFHIYGLFYVPVILTLGALLHFSPTGTLGKWELWFGIIAIILAFWHPFATALFMGFYFGLCLETFWERSRAQIIQSALILFAGMAAIAALVVLFRRDAPMGGDARIFGFLVSYRTNEVNLIGSILAFLLAQMAVLSMSVSTRVKLAAFFLVSILSVIFHMRSLPILLLWLFVVLIKLFRLRCWRLFFLALTASLLPFGGGIGTPMYALFAIIVATYVTALGWSQAEKALSFFKPRYVMGIVVISTIVLFVIRAGIQIPMVTKAASPLLSERERTYQLESILAWLHNSNYCGYELTFSDQAGNPVESLESAITRRYRPPASQEDVRLFWKTVLQCQDAGHTKLNSGTATITFGGQTLADSNSVFEIKGKYAGDASVWIGNRQK
jgi:hypothetical protein